MRIGFEIEAILERAGLALVAIDRHQPRARARRAPRAICAPVGKPAPPSPRRLASSSALQNVFLADARRSAGAQAACSRLRDIGVVVDIGRDDAGGSRRAPRSSSTLGRGRVIDEVMSDLGDRRAYRSSPTQGARTTRMPGPAPVLQFVQQLFRAQHGAGQRIADPNGQRRDVGLAFLHHVEMRVEGRGLEHLGERQLHLVGERREMRCGNLMIFVLDQMQMLDQEIAPPRPVAEQKLRSRRRRGDRSGVPSGSLWPAFVPRPDVRTSGPVCTS